MPKKNNTSDPSIRAPLKKSAYILFATELREKNREKFSLMTQTDIVKELGIAWDSLDEASKKPYLLEEVRQKQAYDEWISLHKK